MSYVYVMYVMYVCHVCMYIYWAQITHIVFFFWYRSAKAIQKLMRSNKKWKRFYRAVAAKNAKIEAERIAKIHTKASNTIGFYWRRRKELHSLKLRFGIRAKVLQIYLCVYFSWQVSKYVNVDKFYRWLKYTRS